MRKSNGDECSISVYKDSQATPQEIATQMTKLKTAFPRMEKPFFNLLAERIRMNGFTGQRLADAVNSVMDNFRYKELNIADIIKFDKRIKLYTYAEVAELWTQGKATPDDFEKREINGTIYRIKKTDILK